MELLISNRPKLLLSKSKVIDRMKIRRERSKIRERCIEDCHSHVPITENRELFFDGRKNKTLIQEKKGNKFYKKVTTEEHVSLVEEPNSKFLGHVTQISSTGKAIAESIMAFLRENEQRLNFTAIGCDGTVVNTGINNGVISFLENKIGRSLQWLICLFHAKELPLRHLFCSLDGKNKGPNELKGELDMQLENCNELLAVTILPIQNNLPLLQNMSDLSTDQKHLMETCIALATGNCLLDLALKNPGKLAHSR